MTKPNLESMVGKLIKCKVTGKEFTIERDGCSFNAAVTRDGQYISDEGVHQLELSELKDRSMPFMCYISTDGNSITGWKGNKLGDVLQTTTFKPAKKSYLHGGTMQSYRVRDVHGGLWYGRSSPGMCILLRPYK